MQRCCSILLIRTIGDWSVALEQDTGASTTGWDECEEEHNREREWLHLVIKQSGAFVWWLRCTNQRAKLFWREFFCTIKSNPISRKWCFKKASKTVLNSQNLLSGLTKLKTQQANHEDFVHNKLCTQEDFGVMLHFSLIPLKVNLFKRDLLKSIFPVCWTVRRKTGYFPTSAKQSS